MKHVTAQGSGAVRYREKERCEGAKLNRPSATPLYCFCAYCTANYGIIIVTPIKLEKEVLVESKS